MICCIAFLFPSRAQAAAASLMKQCQGITRADKRGSVTADISKCVINKKKVQECGTLHLHYLVLKQPSRDTCVDVKGPSGCAPPPVVIGKLESPMLNLNRASVLLLCFVLRWLALV